MKVQFSKLNSAFVTWKNGLRSQKMTNCIEAVLCFAVRWRLILHFTAVILSAWGMPKFCKSLGNSRAGPIWYNSQHSLGAAPFSQGNFASWKKWPMSRWCGRLLLQTKKPLTIIKRQSDWETGSCSVLSTPERQASSPKDTTEGKSSSSNCYFVLLFNLFFNRKWYLSLSLAFHWLRVYLHSALKKNCFDYYMLCVVRLHRCVCRDHF